MNQRDAYRAGYDAARERYADHGQLTVEQLADDETFAAIAYLMDGTETYCRQDTDDRVRGHLEGARFSFEKALNERARQLVAESEERESR